MAEPRPYPRVTFAILLASGVFLYLETFLLPNVPRLAIGDQSIYLHNAARMVEGQIIYRDYDYFTLPGTDVLYMVLFKLFGVRAWIPQAMLILVGLMITWLSIEISRKLMSGLAIFLPGLLFLTLPFSGYLDATHHWYNTLAATLALAVVIKERTPARLIWAGVFWGIATCFAQSLILGPLGFGLFLLSEHYRRKETWRLLLKKESCLFISYGAMVASFNAYFIGKVGLRQFLNYTVLFIARYYPADETSRWRTYMQTRPSLHIWANWPDLVAFPFIHLLLPLIYILFFVRYWRESRLRPREPWERLMLVNVTGLCLFLTVASAPAWNRLYTVSLPGLIMLAWFLDSRETIERIVRQVLWTVTLVLAIVKPSVTQLRWKASLDLPTGRTAFLEPGSYEKTKWLLERTHPSDYFFGDQLAGFVLGLRNPSRIAFIRPNDFTRPEEIQGLVQGLERHQVRFVSWYPGLDDPVSPSGNHLGPLRRYLRDHYHVVKTFSNLDKILERNQ